VPHPVLAGGCPLLCGALLAGAGGEEIPHYRYLHV
jgi:hypothetical protein